MNVFKWWRHIGGEDTWTLTAIIEFVWTFCTHRQWVHCSFTSWTPCALCVPYVLSTHFSLALMNRWGWWGHLNPAIIEFIWTYCTHMWWWTLKHFYKQPPSDTFTTKYWDHLLLWDTKELMFKGDLLLLLACSWKRKWGIKCSVGCNKEIHPFQNAKILLNPLFWNKRCTVNLHIVVHQIWWITVLCKILFCSITIWNYYCYHKNLVNVAHFAGSKHFCTKSLHTDFIFYFQSENKEITTEYILKSKSV